MRGRRVAKIALLAIPLAVLAFALFGYVTMWLWNWLTPALFGWKVITFWQAVGLVILSKILFGGFRGGHGGPRHWRHRMRDRWEKMTPEEREAFRKNMEARCGHFGSPAPPPGDVKA